MTICAVWYQAYNVNVYSAIFTDISPVDSNKQWLCKHSIHTKSYF